MKVLKKAASMPIAIINYFRKLLIGVLMLDKKVLREIMHLIIGFILGLLVYHFFGSGFGLLRQ